MAETGVLLDRRGEPVGPAIAWHDVRGTDEARAIASELGRDRFAAQTGLPASPLCSLSKLAVAARPHARRRGRGALARHARVDRALARRRRRGRAVAGVAHGDALAARPPLVARGAGLARGAGRLPGRAGARRHAAGARRRRAARGARTRSSPSAGHDHVAAMVGAGATGDGDVLHSVGDGGRVRAQHPGAARARADRRRGRQRRDGRVARPPRSAGRCSAATSSTWRWRRCSSCSASTARPSATR